MKPLPHKKFDTDAVHVYNRLLEFRHQTYFVGGCIRDLLLGRTPKDFDIVTAARPRQVKNIFRNSRIIGRRFLVVNVFFGQKNIEVTTFRRTPWKNGLPEKADSLLLDTDNVFGTDEEDAMRRDFTINALFYDIAQRTVIDYVDGMTDLQMGHIRTIGDPEVRFSEDPIRLIRAMRLKSSLGFEMVPSTRQAFTKCVSKLTQISPSRLLLELQKILRSGCSYSCFQYLAEAGIFAIIAPDIHRLWFSPNHPSAQLLKTSLEGLDHLQRTKRMSLGEATLMTAMCFPMLAFSQRKNAEIPTESFCKQKLSKIAENLSLSKNLLDKISWIIRGQFYFEKMQNLCNRKPQGMTREMFLPESLDYLGLRCWNDPKQQELYRFWEQKYRQGNLRNKAYATR